MINSYSRKIVISGNILEIYSYDKPVIEGYTNDHLKNKTTGRASAADEEDKELNREKVMNRAKRDLRRLINSNAHTYGCKSKFVTLTFKENIIDLDIANYEFKKFIKRLNYNLGFKVLYSVVVEFQKRGAIHYHMVIYNVPYIANKALKEIWGNGFVKINNIENVNNVGAYVVKYMTKETDGRLLGRKSYFNSKGLKKSVELKNESEVESIRRTLNPNNKVYSNTYENEYSTLTYEQYNLTEIK